MKDKVIITCAVGLLGLLGLYYFNKKSSRGWDITRDDLHDEFGKEDVMTIKRSCYEDLTAVITPKTVVFPGDPSFSVDPVCSISESSSFSLCKMQMGNHMGTHVDFPAHVIKGGKTSTDYSLDDLIGEGVIIEIPHDVKSIGRTDIDCEKIYENDFVFFKTGNSDISKHEDFTDKYVYITPDAAKALLEKKVRVVGIDYISVDAYEAEELPVHKILLSNDILIVENLELGEVNPGRCKLYIMPLKADEMDGVPARVFMQK